MPHAEPVVVERPVTAIIDYIDLTDASQGYTKWHRVPLGRSLVSVSIEKGSSFTWASAVADMQWALLARSSDDCFAVTYSPAVQFNTTTNSKPSIAATGRGYVRVKTTTAESGADPKAKVVLDFF